MTSQRRHIVCATDLMPRSDAAIERAGQLADDIGADLTFLHVVEPSQAERGLEQVLVHAQSTLRSRAPTSKSSRFRSRGIAVRAGNPKRLVLEEVANASGVDLLVLGPHRRRPVRDVLEGTIAEKVLASRTCAVLVVRARPEGQYRRVLLALDVSPSSGGAIRAAEKLVLSEETTATIIHSDEPPYQGILKNANVDSKVVDKYVQDWRTAMAQDLRKLVRRQGKDEARFDIQVEAGNTVRGILRAVERYRPELLVVGTRGSGRLHRALLGSVANSVIHRVACDVMVVPEGAFQTLDPQIDSGIDSHRPCTMSSATGVLQ